MSPTPDIRTREPTVPPAEEGLTLRAPPPEPKRLSRRVLLAGAGTAGLVVAIALLSGLSERPARTYAERTQDSPAATPTTPEALRALPARYEPAALRPTTDVADTPRDMLWGDRGPPEAYREARLEPPPEPVWSGEPDTPVVTRQAPRASAAPSHAVQGAADPTTAPIFFAPRRDAGRAMPISATAREAQQPIEGGGRRDAFLARQRASADVLEAPLVPPRSPFELQAGAVIPAALVTAVNSDLPGRVIAQVTAPVYDSVTGDHLLIPQGARLIGTYDSANVYGDKRVMLVWNRIIMPNGWSLQLGGMEATDPSGAAGLTARTDNHLDRLAGAIGVSAVLSILANEAEETRKGESLTQSVGDAAAQEAARVGGKIVDRQLNVRPTLRVRPGAPVRVLVSRDIQLRPYRP